ncbi:MAG: glycosyltransferase family 87 protein [Gemmataceae bacterium]
MPDFPPEKPALKERLAQGLAERIWLGWAAGGCLWLVWIVSVILGGGQYDAFNQLVFTDHLAFYSAASMIRDGRAAEIYDNQVMAQAQLEMVGERWQNKYEAYRNLPYYALLYVPTARYPFIISAAIWCVVSILALLAGIYWLGAASFWRTAAWLFCFYPTFASISYGQNTPLSFAVLALTFLLLRRSGCFTSLDTISLPPQKLNRSLLLAAGLVAGLLSFKPTLLIGLAVWGLLDFRRLWPCLAGAGVTILTLSGVSYWLIPQCWTAFFDSLANNASFDQMEWWKNLTPRSFWRLLLGESAAIGPLTIASSLLGVAWFFTIWRTSRSSLPTMFGATILLTLWATPHAMVYEWALLAIPAVIWWNDTSPKKNGLISAWTMLFFFVGILALIGPHLSQFQLKFGPKAIHFCVLGFGWAGWLAGKWRVQSLRTA